MGWSAGLRCATLCERVSRCSTLPSSRVRTARRSRRWTRYCSTRTCSDPARRAPKGLRGRSRVTSPARISEHGHAVLAVRARPGDVRRGAHQPRRAGVRPADPRRARALGRGSGRVHRVLGTSRDPRSFARRGARLGSASADRCRGDGSSPPASKRRHRLDEGSECATATGPGHGRSSARPRTDAGVSSSAVLGSTHRVTLSGAATSFGSSGWHRARMLAGLAPLTLPRAVSIRGQGA